MSDNPIGKNYTYNIDCQITNDFLDGIQLGIK